MDEPNLSGDKPTQQHLQKADGMKDGGLGAPSAILSKQSSIYNPKSLILWSRALGFVEKTEIELGGAPNLIIHKSRNANWH